MNPPGPAPGFFSSLGVPPPRFFVDAALRAGEPIRLPEDVTHHAVRVLRLGTDAPIVLFNGCGGEYPALLRIEGAGAAAQIGAFDPVERESTLTLTLIQALVAADKLDWIVEKAVELGVARLVIAPMQRSVVRLDAARSARRLQHWRDLARAACCQCGRNRVPAVDYFDTVAEAMAAVASDQTRLLLLPRAAGGLPPALPERRAALMVGPEGGVDDSERRRAEAAGFVTAQLGPRILRTETAGLAALAALQALGGDLAGPNR